MARLDAEVFRRALTQSRTRADELIRKGNVKLNGKVCIKPSQNACEDDLIEVIDSIPYVSRAGLKLEYALESFGVSCKDKVVLDVGASTGGFTQCLLQRGASKVWAVDVGRDQMAPVLANDERVILFEGVNARNLNPKLLNGIADMAVMDVSFISQTLLYTSVFSCISLSAPIITLIKPQFEAGKEYLNKSGIVKDKKVHIAVLEKINANTQTNGRYLTKLVRSPITGGDGNIEYLGLFETSPSEPIDFSNIVA